MEPVAARQDRDLGANWDIVHTDAAFGFALIIKAGHIELHRPEGGDGCWSCRSRRTARRIGVHQLSDDAIERFLGVNSIAMSGSGRIQ